MADRKVSGRCLCASVKFTLDDAETVVDACHCSQCRRWSGHVWASVNGSLSGLVFKSGEEMVEWYRASAFARRGFCRKCGSSLFWHAENSPNHKERIAVAAGVLNAPSGLSLSKHIFAGDKGDYYCIEDGLPARDEY